MKLSEFISQSLTEIAKGIRDAQEEYDKYGPKGGQVNPIGLQYKDPEITAVQHGKTSRIGQAVEFDLVVSATESKEATGKAGIEVWNAGIGGKFGSRKQDKSENRIRFKIPVIFPKSEYKEDNEPDV